MAALRPDFGIAAGASVAVGHALNTKAVARRYARERGRAYADLRLIIIHLGNGITVSAYREERMIDNNTPEEGPLGPDRTGSLPGEGTNQGELQRFVFAEAARSQSLR